MVNDLDRKNIRHQGKCTKHHWCYPYSSPPPTQSLLLLFALLPPKHTVLAVTMLLFLLLHVFPSSLSLMVLSLLYLQHFLRSSRNARASHLSHLPLRELQADPAGVPPGSLRSVPVQECVHQQYRRVSLTFIGQCYMSNATLRHISLALLRRRDLPMGLGLTSTPGVSNSI